MEICYTAVPEGCRVPPITAGLKGFVNRLNTYSIDDPDRELPRIALLYYVSKTNSPNRCAT